MGDSPKAAKKIRNSSKKMVKAGNNDAKMVVS